MKTLVIGFLIFSGWSVLATHLYVCKIKGLCNDQDMIRNEISQSQPVVVPDSFALKQQPVLESPGAMSVYFEFDKYDFVADALTTRYTEKAKLFMTRNQSAELLIIGHTDNVGTDEYNMELGERRAQSIKNYFGDMGVSATKSKTVSMGEKEPVDDNRTSEGRAKNRRTEITIK